MSIATDADKITMKAVLCFCYVIDDRMYLTLADSLLDISQVFSTYPTRTITSRTANSFAVSGSGVTMDDSGGSLSAADLVVGGLGTLTNGAAAGSFSTAYQTTAGEAFSYSNSFTAGDANNGTGTVRLYTQQDLLVIIVVVQAPGTIGLDHGLTVTGTTQGADNLPSSSRKSPLLTDD